MTNEQADARAAFARRVDALRGRRVLAVDYWDLHTSGSDPDWDYGDWHHAVMGVQLTTGTGPVTVTWEATFHPYGVDVFLEPITRHLDEDESQRVGPGAGSRWDAFLGQPIRAATARWDTLTLGPATRWDGEVVARPHDVHLPTALRLDFDPGPVWFVAGMPRFPQVDDVFIPGDEIMIVFTAAKMRAMGYADPTFAT
ncbi:hypothetical protein AB0B94_10000 [Micromonospora sp. NPDC048986]|uniref:hypothetical protein n=1 Tax=Micromonospora sp. NPDC048986 TaxID=3155644 RepID=UPI0033CFF8CA